MFCLRSLSLLRSITNNSALSEPLVVPYQSKEVHFGAAESASSSVDVLAPRLELGAMDVRTMLVVSVDDRCTSNAASFVATAWSEQKLRSTTSNCRRRAVDH
jgi:hypothetical protein